MKTLIAALLCTTVASLISTKASAVTVHHEVNANAAGVCVSAFSNQVVRNRATGVRNTGTSAIYVTCSLPGDASGSINTNAYIRVANFGANTQVVNCNLQPGYTNGVTNTTLQGSFSGGVSLAANTYDWIDFYSANYPATSSSGFYNVNVVCLLQPNVELQYVGYEEDEDVG